MPQLRVLWFFHATRFLVALVATTNSSSPTYAGGYTFSNIADTTSPALSGYTFTGFNRPAISGDHVVFDGAYRNQSGNDGHGLWYGDVGVFPAPSIQFGVDGWDLVSPDYRLLGGGSAPALSPLEVTAFTASFCKPFNNASACLAGTYNDGIFISGGPNASNIVKLGDPAPSGTFNQFNFYTAISDTDVAYVATFGSNQMGIFHTDLGGTADILVAKFGDPAPSGTITAFSQFGPNSFPWGISISGSTVAFYAKYTDGEGIFTGTGLGIPGTPLTVIAKTGDPLPDGRVFQFINQRIPSISGNNVAFFGYGDNIDGNYIDGIYVGSGGPLTTIVESGNAAPIGEFVVFDNVSLSGSTAAFAGRYGNLASFTVQGHGIFVGSGAALTTVIKSGDSLFGSTVRNLYVGQFNFDPNGSGRIAFNYELFNGLKGIAVATPILSLLPGDFNNDNVVDAADYVVWRRGFGTTYTQADYDDWRAHFGRTAGSGSVSSAKVPEPTSVKLLVAGILATFARRRAALP